jgi:hypothetical protein
MRKTRHRRGARSSLETTQGIHLSKKPFNMNGNHKIVINTTFSSNGPKIAITLEEIGLPHDIVHVDLLAI